MVQSEVFHFIRALTERFNAAMSDKKRNAIDFEAEDFEAIEQAVLDTERGRWFLAEYAARNRRSETTSLLTSLTKLERAIGSELQHMNNSTSGFQSQQILAQEFDTLIKAIGLTDRFENDPIELLAHQISANAFSLAQVADAIRDCVDELALINLPPETVIKLSQATQKVISLAAHQTHLSRHVEALGKIMAYVRSRLEDTQSTNEIETSADVSAALSIASFDRLREKIAALDVDN